MRGRPFKKGQSGNPGGRPKGHQEFAALARQYAPECLERLMFWARTNKEAASVAAARAIIERAWGRPPSTDEATAIVIPAREGEPSSTIRVEFVRASHRDEDDE